MLRVVWETVKMKPVIQAEQGVRLQKTEPLAMKNHDCRGKRSVGLEEVEWSHPESTDDHAGRAR
jgi:hypothetical protein